MASPRPRRLAVLAVGVAVAILVPVAPAAAQLDPGNFDIRQHGSVVGHIFVPAHLSPAVYVEHWIVYRAYVYPSSHAPVATHIVPSGRRSATEMQFFREVEFGPGSRYIRVLAQESLALPTGGGSQAFAADHASLLPIDQVPMWAVAAVGCLAFRLAASAPRRRRFRNRPRIRRRGHLTQPNNEETEET